MSSPYNPHAIVEIDGQRFDSWEHDGLFKSVHLELPTNETAEAEFVFFDPQFRWIDKYSLSTGPPLATMRFFLGFGQQLGQPMFKGLLARVERGRETTTFVAYDMGFKMKLLKRAGYHNKKNDLAILKGLAERNGLMFEGPETPLALEPHNAMTQDEQTDWEHALERAHDAGLVIFVRQDTLFAKYPAKVGTPVLTLRNRKDFLLKNNFDFTFRTPENQEGRPRKVQVRGRGKGGNRLVGDSDTSQRGRERIVLKRDIPGKHTKAKLSRRAQAQKELEREHSFEGIVNCLLPVAGRKPDVRDTVRIEEVGKLFSGDYICDSVSYEFAPGALEISLNLYRDVQNF